MVTTLSDTEFLNVWNSIVRRDDFDPKYHEAHWGAGVRFSREEIEENKPVGWNKLREIVNDVEQRCSVYYYCEERTNKDKLLYFIVFGENAMDEVAAISVQLQRMAKYGMTTLEDEKKRMRGHDYGSGRMSETVAAQCPLF